ncbi:MAG: GNAT family N-acetyltransferase [Deltaproteobacteria bacterium]|nr:GNAT family N-acetyltransferase [Deltaproteobacteria bacterium]
MGKSGRFGKYGEHKRMARLRNSGIREMRPGKKMRPGSSADVRPYRRPSSETEVLIREAQPSDAPFIQSLSKKAFGQYGPYEEMLPEWFLAGITLTLVAVQGRVPVGFAMLGIIHSDPLSVRESELVAIAVEPEAHRRGIGDRLMRNMIKAADERCVERMHLHTAVDNLPAQTLFQKYGFSKARHKEKFYPKGQDALMMVRRAEWGSR